MEKETVPELLIPTILYLLEINNTQDLQVLQVLHQKSPRGREMSFQDFLISIIRQRIPDVAM